ncbi:MAG: ribose-5-phosphate isomerase [Candidatus Taylorbacteria bacterium CG11_big_fil_rev_8_21_14_0_20_46_11]|uniref:Ribose-5-phosphate isomerase n=1 Tax=Candidatus Taylorbacteria bacterium CG11_big_fil_rev_8_21_14_0_20_46_11 TaxID=1975025 RepID=A0A2H0KAG1_9BACT|nr:MAG: ribose-5-phosphate isomerase [Candidatus Taylorbacteria bacterium CG11_big_fil_rev_8_21_14_0_20_46_11]
MRIYFSGDHAGYKLREELIGYVTGLGHEVIDMGPDHYDPQDDYTDFVFPMARKVAEDAESRGIICAGSGEGEAIVANRVKGVRASVYYGGDLNVIKAIREHNDSTILSLGARFLSLKEAKTAVKLWLETPFSGEERHIRRINKIDAMM